VEYIPLLHRVEVGVNRNGLPPTLIVRLSSRRSPPPQGGEEINFRKLFSEQIVSLINGELLFDDSPILKESDGTRMKGNRHPFIGILQEDRLELHMDRIQF